MQPLLMSKLAVNFHLEKGGHLPLFKARAYQNRQFLLGFLHDPSPDTLGDLARERRNAESGYRRSYRHHYQRVSKALAGLQQVPNDFFRGLKAVLQSAELFVAFPAHASKLTDPGSLLRLKHAAPDELEAGKGGGA